MNRWQRFRLKFINRYPPLFGAGIRISATASDYSSSRGEMKLTALKRNLVGTHLRFIVRDARSRVYAHPDECARRVHHACRKIALCAK